MIPATKKPYVFLRCKKCGGKTDHVMVNTNFLFRFGENQIEETYECQECGEKKKIYEFTQADVFGFRQQEKMRIPKKAKNVRREDHLEVIIRKKKK